MEALLCEKLGDPTVPYNSPESPITIARSHPVPSLASPTAVRVRIHATSLNYANYLQILGKYQEKPPLPFIPGSDYSGVIEAVGDAISRFKVLLVLGAAGGVELSVSFEIGKVCGGDESSLVARKCNLRSLGVDHVVDLTKGNVTESVKKFQKIRDLKGVDVLYDPVGGKLTKESLKLLNWGANILVIGFASGEVPVIPANIALVKVLCREWIFPIGCTFY
ncbi:hypothetical protein J5N97_003924 [Dioscorea zingiberensis]|uniref:Uncharacterized protein n=1 Tax=Dioscorea zingiberensis TaxID=325984 RepID=A0A9D5D7H3_9LILI|nr:hypothetical protein J5N97_003924 [Dioscorea zingiberensis]